MARMEAWLEAGFCRRFGDSLVVKGHKNIEEVVLRVRVIAGFLATRVSPQRREVDDCDSLCRICGEGRESNHHVMWECTGCPVVVMKRRELVRGLRKVWTGLGLAVEEVEVLAAVHSLNARGGLAYHHQAR